MGTFRESRAGRAKGQKKEKAPCAVIHRGSGRPGRSSAVAAIVLGLSAREADAQGVAGSPYMSSYRVSDYFAGPGWYGTSYGFASYGFPQTYSVFSAYPGPSYRDRPALRALAGVDSASASGGPATPRRDISTELRIIPRPDSLLPDVPGDVRPGRAVDGPRTGRSAIMHGAGPRPER